MKKYQYAFLICIITSIVFTDCNNNTVKKIREKLNYKTFLDKFRKNKQVLEVSDTTNMFDREDYDPSKMDSADVINTISTIYEGDSAIIKKIGADDKNILNNPSDSLQNVKDTFTTDIKKIAPAELKALKYNLEQLKVNVSAMELDSVARNAKQKNCAIWADVSKKDQRLYLYVEGICVDTFKISSGDAKHKTPNIDRRPSGPQFSKYTSKKYPGGNYNGLGNMPYVLFVQGGYGLHGTTLGNIKKLGTPASHGCVRLHPDNAKIIFELVKAAGVENTWVTIRE